MWAWMCAAGKVCALGSGMHEGCVFLGNRDSAMVFAFVCEMREGCVLLEVRCEKSVSFLQSDVDRVVLFEV